MTPTTGKAFPRRLHPRYRQYMRRIGQTVPDWTDPMSPHLRRVWLSCGHQRVVSDQAFGMVVCLTCKAEAEGQTHADQT